MLDSQSSTAVKLSKVKTFHFVLRRNKSVANLSIWVLNVGPERKLVYWCWMKNRSIYSLYDTHSWTWWWWGGNFSYLSYHIEAATKVRFHIISNEYSIWWIFIALIVADDDGQSLDYVCPATLSYCQLTKSVTMF